ncbi:hypothetical protein GGF40_000706 [Coemansia sp. RSA 1286]|nr:hypothetical protein GGF40_000706 [Coemansia sp. RSA 1286]
MHDTDALDETKHAAVDGEIENTSSHDEDTEYEYETTEYYVVASLPPRAIARASEAANDSKGVSARLSHATRTNQTVSDRSSDIDEEPNEPTIGRRNGRPQQPQYALIDMLRMIWDRRSLVWKYWDIHPRLFYFIL